MNTIPIIQNKQRIQWIDALRGLTMFLVVFQHIFTYCFHEQTEICFFFRTFRMPLFFFISGFVAYDIKRICSAKIYRQQMFKKMRIQIIPILVFGLIYTLFSPFPLKSGLSAYERIVHFITSPWKYGYWFTWALMGMFAIYYSISFLLRKINRKWTYGILILLSFIFFLYSPNSTHNKLNTNNIIVGIFSLRHIAHYFQFFVFGSIFAHYRDRIFKYLDNIYVSGAIVSLFFGLYIALYANSHLWLPHNNYSLWAVSFVTLFQNYCGILTLIMLFRNNESVFSQQKSIGRILQFIGRRTLDIYLIHFFFLPDMKSVGDYFAANPNILISSLFAFILAIAVLSLSLLVSAFLRTSPLLAHYLFGQKIQSHN